MQRQALCSEAPRRRATNNESERALKAVGDLPPVTNGSDPNGRRDLRRPLLIVENRAARPECAPTQSAMHGTNEADCASYAKRVRWVSSYGLSLYDLCASRPIPSPQGMFGLRADRGQRASFYGQAVERSDVGARRTSPKLPDTLVA